MRPFRFGLVPGPGPIADAAHRAEDLGYDLLLFPDHVGWYDPFVAAGVAAAVTTRLKVGTQVVNNQFRDVGLMAQSALSVHLLSGGRFELGLGTGYAAEEHRAVGQVMPPAGERVRRLGATVTALRRLLDGDEVTVDDAGVRLHRLVLAPPPAGADGPGDGGGAGDGGSGDGDGGGTAADGPMALVHERPAARLPIMVGGDGDRLLRLAARDADTVQFTGFTSNQAGELDLTHFSSAGLADRVAFVRDAAAGRAEEPELSVLVQFVAGGATREDAARAMPSVREGRMAESLALDSPFVLLGPPPAVAEQVIALRERFGISHLSVFEGRQEGFADVVARLAGT